MLSTSTATTSTTNHPSSRPVNAMHGEAAAAAAAAAAANAVAALAWQQQGQQQQPSHQQQPSPVKKKASLFFHRFTLKSLLHNHNHSNSNISTNNNGNVSTTNVKQPKSGGGVLRLTRGKSSSSSKRRSTTATLRHASTLTAAEDSASALNLSSSTPPAVALVDGAVADSQQQQGQQQQQQHPVHPLNVMQWLETTCPADLLPSILAYCGPQKTAMLGRTNRHWKAIVFGHDNEATWRVLCQDLYKWKEGDEEPASWMAHYRQNPCVPIDYSSIQAALQLAALSSSARHHHKNNSTSTTQLKQVRSLKIWIRPGRYHLKQAIQVQAPPGVELVIETMQLPANIFQKQQQQHSIPPSAQVMEQPEVAEQPRQQRAAAAPPPPPPRRSASNAFLQFIRRGARSNPAAAAFEEAEATERSETSNGGGGDVLEVFGGHHQDSHHPQQQQQTHATLILQTRRHNEPAVCVRQGKVTLTNLEIQHFAHGLDIWNGNAAIQVQPPTNNNNDLQPLRLEPRPTALLQGCKVTSSSGRGIVNIDGGHVTIRQCAIYNCAATGVYIGGPGSQAILQDSDVVRNGVGNHHTTNSSTGGRTRGGAAGRGIARGHSGVYLEQGSARIRNCNISENTLTGISAVSPDNAILHLTDTSLVGNGTFQLELPSIGSNARDQSRLDNNQLSTRAGSGRVRSGLLPASAAAAAASVATNEPATATIRG